MSSGACLQGLLEAQTLREADDWSSKPKEGEAVPFKSESIGFKVMTSYIVDGKTGGLLKAAEVMLPDIYSALYVMPVEQGSDSQGRRAAPSTRERSKAASLQAFVHQQRALHG